MWMITFYADWCPYCKTWDEELGHALSDPKLADKKIKFGAVDVMANRDLTQKFGIRRSPTVKVFGLDKYAPEDYSGHRKHADVIDYIDEYTHTHDYVIIPVVTYEYNVDAIVHTIASAHEERVAVAKNENKAKLNEIEEQYVIDVNAIKTEFDEKLKMLIEERSNALNQTGTDAESEYNGQKEMSAEAIAALDAEAIEVIESIIQNNKDGVDLTEFIAELMKDWFTIEWNEYNRREYVVKTKVPVEEI